MIGGDAEEEVLKLVQKYFPEAKRTRRSGAINNDGDITGVPGVLLEVKRRSGVGFTVSKDELDKARRQALKQYPPENWAIAITNKDGRILCCCDLEMLLSALLPEEPDWRPV